MTSEVSVNATTSVAGDVFAALAPRFDGDLPPMLIGAEARDVLHHAQGFSFDLVSSSDVDVVVLCDGWDKYRRVITDLPASGETGFRFIVADCAVDILPFGEIESPVGELRPPWPHDGFNVFAMREVYDHSWSVDFGNNVRARIPSPPGFAALKLKAWIDRSANSDHRDVKDLALCLYWTLEDAELTERFWTSELERLAHLGVDVGRAVVHLFGGEIRRVIGSSRARTLASLLNLARLEDLAHRMTPSGTPELANIGDEARRLVLLTDLVGGLRDEARV